MEVKFKNVNFPRYLKEFNLDIESGKITTILGDYSKDIIGRGLIGLSKFSAGDILVDKLSPKNNILAIRKKVGCLFNNLTNYTFKSTVYSQLSTAFEQYDGVGDKDKRISESLKMAGLNDTYLKVDPKYLSLSEQKKLILASTMMFNPEVIVLDHFELHLSYLEQKKIKSLLKKIQKKFNKTIIIITNNVDFVLGFADNYVILNEGFIVASGNKEIVYNTQNKKYIDVPQIVEVTWKIREKGIKLNNYSDIKDLMKAIYREVK